LPIYITGVASSFGLWGMEKRDIINIMRIINIMKIRDIMSYGALIWLGG